MSKTLYVTDRNPEVFFESLAEQVKAGFYVTDTIPGQPRFDLINEVELTRTDKPSQRNDLSAIVEVNISGYNETSFLLDVQDAILQGFEIVVKTISLDPHRPLYVTLVKPQTTEKEDPAPRKAAGRPRTKE